VKDSEARFALKFYQGKDLMHGAIPLAHVVRVGRHAKNNVVLNHNSVSRHHATFLVEPRGDSFVVILRDEGSTNGCTVNGSAVHGRDLIVGPADSIKIGVFFVKIEEQRQSHLPNAIDDPGANIFLETSPSSKTALPNVRLRALYELASRIPFVDGEKVLEETANAVAECLRFEVLYILLEKDCCSPLVCTRTSERGRAAVQVPVSRTLINKCLNEGVAILAGKDAGESGPPAESAVLRSLKSVMCAPLLSHGKNLGVVYASSPSDATYSSEDLQFLILIASVVAHNFAAKEAMRVLQEEKEKVETILESLQEGVILLDDGFRVLTVNSAASQALGGGPVVGRRLDEVFSKYRHSLSLATLPSLTSFQIEEAPPDGANRGHAAALPRVYAGTIGRNEAAVQAEWKYVICLRDISESRHAEYMKSIFINRLAHKIVTPLTVVTEASFLVAEQMARLDDRELSSIIAESLKQSEQCSNLIRQFVDYTALSFGGSSSTLEWKTCRLEDLVGSALTSNADMISAQNFKVVSLFREGATEVHGDPSKLELVFHHLVQNAAKFGKRGGTLMVGAQADAKMLKVLFLDDGPGIPPDEMRNVGEMFYQIDPHNTGEVPGAGIGLWLVREIVRCHGGEVKLSSPTNDDGGGTLVEVYLPGVTKEASLRESAGAVTAPLA
jgi:signal transduction histidine kinase